MLSVTRALRALVRLRVAELLPVVETRTLAARLTSQVVVVDPPAETVEPIGDPPRERTVEIPLYLES